MKYYVIEEIDTKTTDGWTIWEGFDYEEALKAKENAISDFERYHTPKEKEHRVLDFQVYDLPDDIDTSDKMAISDACLECGGWDNF